MISKLKAMHTLDDARTINPAHAQLLRHMLAACRRRGCEPVDQAIHLCRAGGHLMAAGWRFAESYPGLPAGTHVGMGVTYSTVGRSALRFYGGISVPERDSAIVTASWAGEQRGVQGDDGRWEGTELDYRAAAESAVDRLTAHAAHLPRIANYLRKARLDEAQVNHHVMEAASEGIMPPSRGFRVRSRVLRVPGEPCNAWDLAVAFGDVATSNPPENVLRQMFRFYQLLVPAAAIA